MASFALRAIAHDDEGFGPSRAKAREDEVKALIYAPFNASDRFGRAADWMAHVDDERSAHDRDARQGRSDERKEWGDRENVQRERANGERANEAGGRANANARTGRERNAQGERVERVQNGGLGQSGVETVFNFVADIGEDESFSLVDNASSRSGGRGRSGGRWMNAPPGGRGFGRGGRAVGDEAGRDLGVGAERERMRQARIQSRKQQQWNTWAYNRQQQQVQYSASVDIRPDWEVVETVQFPEIMKSVVTLAEPAPQDLVTHGSLSWFDKSYDRVTPKSEVTLRRRADEPTQNLTASDDPVMRKLASEGAGNVFATDSVLVTVMCAARSNYSWDIVIRKKDGKIFLDKRADGNFDQLTVSETAQEAITDDPEDINGVPQLSAESTRVNSAFCQQVLSSDREAHKLGEPIPFFGANDTDSVAYRYRRWNVDEKTQLIARCELNGVSESKGLEKGKPLLTLVKALNEFDSKITGIDWRLKIETQRGAVIANELKNNANKLAKWTAMAMLSGAEQIKLGFVSRLHPRDPNSHVVLNTQTYKTTDFAQQINLKETSMWGAFKMILETCRKFPDGTFLCVKDPSKGLLRFYKFEEKAPSMF